MSSVLLGAAHSNEVVGVDGTRKQFCTHIAIMANMVNVGSPFCIAQVGKYGWIAERPMFLSLRDGFLH